MMTPNSSLETKTQFDGKGIAEMSGQHFFRKALLKFA